MATLWRILSLAFFFELALHVARPMVPLRLTELGASPIAIGIILTTGGLVPLLFSLPLGRLSDRIGPRRVLMIGTAMAALGFVILATAKGAAMMTLGQGVTVAGVTTAVIAAQVMVSLLGQPEDREQNFGWFGTAVAISQLAGPPIGGLLAESFGLATAFLVSAAFCGIPLVQAYLLKESPAAAPISRQDPAPRHSTLSLMGVPEIKYGILMAFLIVFAFDIRASFFPVFLEQDVGLSRSQIGLVFTLQGLAALVVRPAMGRLSRSFGRWHLLTASLLVAVPSFAMIPFTSGLVGAAVAMAGLGLATGLSQPLTMSIIAGAAAEEARGLALGGRQTAQRLGNALSPVLMGAIASLAGLGAPFLAAAVIMAGCAGVSILGSRKAGI